MNKHKIFRGVRNILEGEPDDWLGQESVLKSLGITNIRINLSDHYLLSIPLSIILCNWDAWGRSWPLVFARANRARAFRPIHTRDFSPGACSRGTLRKQSSSVCTNDFMGILHPREQNFHPAKCSTIFNRLNIWEQAPGQIERTWKRSLVCTDTCKWSWSMLRVQNPSSGRAKQLRGE